MAQAKIKNRVRRLAMNTQARRWHTAVSREPGRAERQLNMNKDTEAVAGYNGPPTATFNWRQCSSRCLRPRALPPLTDGADDAESRSDRDGPGPAYCSMSLDSCGSAVTHYKPGILLEDRRRAGISL